MLNDTTTDNLPLTKNGFAEVFESLESDNSDRDTTVQGRWLPYVSDFDELREALEQEIIRFAWGDHSLGNVAMRTLLIGLELGYRMKEKELQAHHT